MRILSTAIAIIAIAMTASAGPTAPTGFGQELTASTNATQVAAADGFAANVASVYNTGTNKVYALVNCKSKAEFDARVAAGTAVPVAASQVFTFDCGSRNSIDTIWISTTNSTSTVTVGAF
jgi:hypothetical protein